eukprot:1506154-Heterocapsa_arctica.AAC.1
MSEVIKRKEDNAPTGPEPSRQREAGGKQGESYEALGVLDQPLRLTPSSVAVIDIIATSGMPTVVIIRGRRLPR